MRTGSPSTSSTDDVRVWPLCFAIAIEKSQRVRPNVMVGASSLLAGLTYHLQQSDASLRCVFRRSTSVSPRIHLAGSLSEAAN